MTAVRPPDTQLPAVCTAPSAHMHSDRGRAAHCRHMPAGQSLFEKAPVVFKSQIHWCRPGPPIPSDTAPTPSRTDESFHRPRPFILVTRMARDPGRLLPCGTNPRPLPHPFICSVIMEESWLVAGTQNLKVVHTRGGVRAPPRPAGAWLARYLRTTSIQKSLAIEFNVACFPGNIYTW